MKAIRALGKFLLKVAGIAAFSTLAIISISYTNPSSAFFHKGHVAFISSTLLGAELFIVVTIALCVIKIVFGVAHRVLAVSGGTFVGSLRWSQGIAMPVLAAIVLVALILWSPVGIADTNPIRFGQ